MIATSAAAPLMKNAVRTTFVSGSCSAIRRFGCHAGTRDADASLFFDSDGGILRGVLHHQAEQAEPVKFSGGLGKRVRHGHAAGPEPGERVELKGGDAERGRERPLEPGELRGELDANHLPDRLARLDLVESNRGLQLLEEPLYQERAHSREVKAVGSKELPGG